MDVQTFRIFEIFAWIFTAYIFVLICWPFLVFICISIAVRYFYFRFKNSKLKSLKIDPRCKTVIVTGCDTGFGHHLALRLYRQGFNVFATCLNMEGSGARALKKLGPKHSNRLTVVHLDVTNDSMVQKVLEQVKEECAETGLWGLVNNAGMNFVGDAELTTMDQYQLLFDINLYGMVRMCKAFLPLLRRANGRIVNVTSVKGLISIPVSAPYTMTKFAGEAFSEVLRQEMAIFGVKVITVEPSNFGGATGCLNTEGMARIKNQLNAQWEAASDDVKELYGHFHLMNHLKGAKTAASLSDVSIEPVLEVFEDALTNVCPKIRYLVDGTKTFYDFDVYAMLARVSYYLPERIYDRLREYYFPYKHSHS